MGMDHRESRPNSVKIVPSAVRYSEPMQDLRLAVTAIVIGTGVEIALLLAWEARTWLLRAPTRVRSGSSLDAFGH